MATETQDNPVVAEGSRLARQCLWLRTKRTSARQPLVGIWEGSGVVPPPRGDWEHWLTVNCTWLGQHGFDLRGCISVYGNEDMAFVAVNDPEARLPRSVKEGLALFAEKSKSLPPRVGVEVHGGKSFQRWRAELDEKAASDAWGQYESTFRRLLPLAEPLAEGRGRGAWRLAHQLAPSPASVEAHARQFYRALRTRFTRVGSGYRSLVGPDALGLLRSGVRFTDSVTSPRRLDFKLPARLATGRTSRSSRFGGMR